MDSPDIQAKYHKLATEYSKLRAQNQVLKKAVVDEQSRTSNLKEDLKACNQSLRKVEQENDSVTFRNQQLSKRITLLQDDLDQLQSKNRNKNHTKGEKSSDASLSSALENKVYAEELRSKISETAALHSQLADLEFSFRSRISELENRQETVTREASIAARKAKETERDLQAQIRTLEAERITLEVNMSKTMSEVNALRSEVESNNSHTETSSVKEDQLIEEYEDCLRSVDSNTMGTFADPVKHLCEGFKKFLNAVACSVDEGKSKVDIKKIKEDLHLWDSLSNSYTMIFQTAEELKDCTLAEIHLEKFTQSVILCASGLRRALPMLSESFSCGKLRSSFGRLVSCWAGVTTPFSSMSSQKFELINFRNILEEVLEKLNKLLCAAEEVFTFFQKDEDCDEQISSYLILIVNSLLEIRQKLKDNVLSSDIPLAKNKNISSVEDSISRSSSSKSEDPNPRPSDLSLTVSHNSSGDCLRPSSPNTRLVKIESERDHWKLECQITKHKLEREEQKCARLEALFKDPKHAAAEETKDKKNSQQSNGDSTSLLCEVIQSTTDIDREMEIRNHFTNRCSQLSKQLSSLNGQATLFKNECETLMRRLTISEESKLSLESELDVQRTRVALLKEELETTSRNYEEQISAMSDHLANLNEKYTMQTDLVEQLKFEIKNKKSRK